MVAKLARGLLNDTLKLKYSRSLLQCAISLGMHTEGLHIARPQTERLRERRQPIMQPPPLPQPLIRAGNTLAILRRKHEKHKRRAALPVREEDGRRQQADTHVLHEADRGRYKACGEGDTHEGRPHRAANKALRNECISNHVWTATTGRRKRDNNARDKTQVLNGFLNVCVCVCVCGGGGGGAGGVAGAELNPITWAA